MFIFHSACDHPYLHSFPTRRSSDLPTLLFLPVESKHDLRPRIQSAGGQIRDMHSQRVMGVHILRCTPSIEAPMHHRRSEEHTSELQSPYDLVCRLLLEKKKHKEKTR